MANTKTSISQRSRKVRKRRKPKTSTKKKRPKIPKKWVDIIQAIPGYDPIATAGNCYFDVKAAEIAIDFFPDCLHHVKGDLAGEPFKITIWEKAFVANLFGWKRLDGTRRYREALLYIAKKNGKTTLCAGIVLLLLFVDGEPGSEIYSAAADREQASMVFDQATGMVRQDDDLYSRSTLYRKAISLNDNSGSYKPISADANTKHGYNVHAAIIDELHAQPNADLVDTLLTSVGARKQPLVIHVTTADYYRPSICNEKHDYASKVRDGIIEDESFLPVIFEAKPEDDWKKKSTWKKANPNMGITFDQTYLEREFKRAQETPRYENTFKRVHLNIITEQVVRWLKIASWKKCEIQQIPQNELMSAKWFAGLDLASTTDIAAFVLYSPDNHVVIPRFWIPSESAYLRERRDRVPYLTWARQGFITLTEGNVIDYDFIRKDINSLGEQYNICGMGFDRWGSQQIQTQLSGDGFDVQDFGQGFASMSAPSKEFERLVVGGLLRPGMNPVLRWMISNVAVETDAADNIKPSKSKSKEKIDGIVALIMAIGISISEDPEEQKESIYEKQGIRSV